MSKNESKMSDVASAFDANAANDVMDRYSRQIAALGVDTMRNLGGLRVLIIGQAGVGVETAKDLILQGPKAVTVWDPEIASMKDLGTNFYLTADDVGVNRRSVVFKKLAELNPYVEVSEYQGELDNNYLADFGAVIVTLPLPPEQLFRINEFCHHNNITFIYAVTQGGFSAFFADFGPKHVVTDLDGEPKRDFVIQSFSKDLIQITSESHGMSDGDGVVFSDIEGPLAPLNDATGITIKRVYVKSQGRNVLVPNKFRIDISNAKFASGEPIPADFLDKNDWNNGGGNVSEVKPTKEFTFRTLRESLRKPIVDDSMGTDVTHMDQGQWFNGMGTQLHLGLNALIAFQAEKGRRPRLHNTSDARELVAIAKRINEENKKTDDGSFTVEEVNTGLMTKIALYAEAELSGFCAFLGGVAAQEVLKRFGKWTPCHQWFYYDMFNIIPKDVPVDATPTGTRYDHQISIFGQAFQRKIMNERWFLVGCGALGCEYLKAFALMGIGCGPKGHVYITDMDRIELSNLSRQFLFRAEHVQKPKSVCAAQVVTTMNPELGKNITCFEAKVCPETENQFHQGFWNSLTGVWNALDNVHARKYTDSKCLLHGLPLMESGTQGTKANSEVILPHKTKSYSDIKDQETGGIAACTLRNFPNLIVHCIEWAKPKFQELFELQPQQVNSFLTDKEKFFASLEKQGDEAAQLKFLQEIHSIVSAERNYVSCVALAQKVFVENHRDIIKNLTWAMPEDSRVIDSATGADLGPFWTGAKRFPHAAELDLNDEKHAEYLFYAANLYAFLYGLPYMTREQFREAAAKVPPPAPWTPPKYNNIQLEDGKDENKSAAAPNVEAELRAQVQELVETLKGVDTSKLAPVRVNEFEKDDDTNFHIDFITACSNMRAWNYRIKPATRLHVKTTAGKIIAALATTTAMITGVTTLEYYKLALGENFLHKDRFYNTNVNLAAAVFNAFEPDNPIREQISLAVEGDTINVPYPPGFTSWDYLDVNLGDITVREFVERFPKLFWGVRVDQLYKADITEADIAEGRGVSLYTKPLPFRPPQIAVMMLKRPNITEEQRKQYEKQIEDAKASWEAQQRRLDRKLSDLYFELYGGPKHPEDTFFVLDGAYRVPEAEDDVELWKPKLKLANPDEVTEVSAILPRIRFYYK